MNLYDIDYRMIHSIISVHLENPNTQKESDITLELPSYGSRVLAHGESLFNY